MSLCNCSTASKGVLAGKATRCNHKSRCHWFTRLCKEIRQPAHALLVAVVITRSVKSWLWGKRCKQHSEHGATSPPEIQIHSANMWPGKPSMWTEVI
jgi:hypothetical protein